MSGESKSITEKKFPLATRELINLQKCTTLFWCLFLAWCYDKLSSPTAMVYCAIHGSYGYCWLIKDAAFTGKNTLGKMTMIEGIFGCFFIFLPGYWTIPWLAISNPEEASPFMLFSCIFLYTIGVVTMMVSDCQTYFLLETRPGRLIANGMNRYTKHPNYGGEIILYGTFCILARHWLAFAIFGLAFDNVLLPMNIQKEESLSRYPAWEEYSKQSWRYFPNIFAIMAGKKIGDELLDKPKTPKATKAA